MPKRAASSLTLYRPLSYWAMNWSRSFMGSVSCQGMVHLLRVQPCLLYAPVTHVPGLMCYLSTRLVHTRCAQQAVPADRFAREIVRFLTLSCAALAAAERQAVGRQAIRHNTCCKVVVLLLLSNRRKGTLCVAIYETGTQ